MLLSVGIGIGLLLNARDSADSSNSTKGFRVIYPGATLANHQYTASALQSSVQEGMKIVTFSLQATSTGSKITFTEQSDPERTAYEQFSKKEGVSKTGIKLGSLATLYDVYAAAHVSGTTVFAHSNQEISVEEWTNIFNSLTLKE